MIEKLKYDEQTIKNFRSVPTSLDVTGEIMKKINEIIDYLNTHSQ